MKNKVIIFASVFLIVVAGAFYYLTGTPEYSLYQLKSAVENKDSEKALKFIDLDSIIDNMMVELMADQKPAKNGWEAAGGAMGKGLIAMMMPAMKESMKSMFKTSIVSSDETSQLNNLKKVSAWSWNIERSGSTAVIKSDDVPVSFKMTKHPDGYWRIVQIIDQKKKA